MTPKPTILLTGAKGNLGQALRRRDLRSPTSNQWRELTRTDWARLPELLLDLNIVLHAASDLRTPLWQQPAQVLEANIMSTMRLLEAMPRSARFIFVSSCAVYGRSEVTREETQAMPISLNGIGKLYNEVMIEEYCRHHKIKYQILRVFNTFGGQDRFSILSHLHQALRTGAPFTLYNQGISQRDFIHVDDVADILLKLIPLVEAPPILNVGSGTTTRIREIVEAFQKKYPALKVKEATRDEAEYSRADITRLECLVPKHPFRGVLEFIREEL